MQPQHRAPDVKKPPMQAIPLSQIDSRHPRPSSPLITLIIRLYLFTPEIARLLPALLTEADVDQEVVEVWARLEVRCRFLGGPFVDGACACCGAVPASELTCALGLVVHGCA